MWVHKDAPAHWRVGAATAPDMCVSASVRVLDQHTCNVLTKVKGSEWGRSSCPHTHTHTHTNAHSQEKERVVLPLICRRILVRSVIHLRTLGLAALSPWEGCRHKNISLKMSWQQKLHQLPVTGVNLHLRINTKCITDVAVASISNKSTELK